MNKKGPIAQWTHMNRMSFVEYMSMISTSFLPICMKLVSVFAGIISGA